MSMSNFSQLKAIFLMLVCLLAFGFPAHLGAQDKPAQNKPAEKSSKEKSSQDKPAQLTESLTPQQTLELMELLALRARMGGGATEQLKGVVSGADPEQQFMNSLKSRIREQESNAEKMPPAQALLPSNTTV